MRSVRVFVAIAVAAGLSLGALAARASSPDEDAVRVALHDAMSVAQSSFSAPENVEAARGLSVGEAQGVPAALKARTPVAIIDKADQAGRIALSRHFTGQALAVKLSDHGRMVAAQKSGSIPGFTPLGGGASQVALTSIRIRDDVAAVTATVGTWARMAQVQPDGRLVVSQPTADLIVKAKLARTAEGWKVSTFSWKFAPGNGP